VGAPVRQTNFGAGELDPSLHGRTDLPLFSRGAKTMRNFVPLKTGAAMSRPGTTFVREAKVVVRPAILPPLPNMPPRLVPYIYSDERTFVLELGDRYIRVHTLGRTVMNGANPYEVLSPWRIEVLPYLKFAQSGAVMTIVSGSFPNGSPDFKDFPYELVVRVNPATGAPSIELTALTSAIVTAATVDDAGVVQYFPNKEFSPPAPLFADVDAPTNVTAGFAVVTGSIAVPDATHPEREWQVMVSAIIQDPATGATYETRGELISEQWDGTDFDGTSAPIPDDKWVIYPDKPLTYRRGTSAFGVAPPWKVLGYFFYRGRGGVFGWVGSTDSREFIDLGQEPDFAKQPPLGQDPFIILRSSGALARYEFPLSVAFFESRRVWGGTNGGIEGVSPNVLGLAPTGTKYGRPMTLLASSNRDYYDHDKRLAQHVSGEALEYALALYRREEIRHLVSRNRLLVLTNASVMHFGGTQFDPLDFNSVNGRATDDVGSAHVTPVVVGSLVLFVRNKGFGARMLVPTGDSERPYRGLDVSEQAKHLFVGSGASKQILEWCLQEDPWGVVWAVRGDGALLSLTLIAEDQIGWARHDTDGEYESICSVPEGEEDAVYVVVKRTINGAEHRYIERFTSRVRRVLEGDSAPLYLSEPDADDTDQLYPTDVCLDCAFTYADVPALQLAPTGLAALEGKEVYVIAKGLPVLGPFVVTAGAIDLTAPTTLGQGLEDLPDANAVDSGSNPIFVARIGLGYVCDLETLAIRGGAELRQKTIAAVGFELDNSKGVQAGQDFDHLDDWVQREVSDSYGAVSAASTLLYTIVDNTWDKDARIVLRQSQPLPVTVVGLARDLETDEG
jgi:hypothetical protein